MTRYYTGVGSRSTPPEVLAAMSGLAFELALIGYTLRSGAAEGADSAFEQGAIGSADIYLPWPRFGLRDKFRLNRASLDAYKLAATLHPRWASLGSGARALHARNCHQVLGDDLATPSDFLVCWTPDGCQTTRERTKDTGGTATAIVLACQRGIPVFNLKNEGALDACEKFARRSSPLVDLFGGA